MKIFIDKGAWLALSTSGDSDHAKFRDAFKNLLEEGHRFYTTNVVIGEVLDELKKRVGSDKAHHLYEIIEEAWFGTHLHILWIGRKTQWDAIKMWKRSPDSSLSVFDFASIILMNRRNIRVIMAKNMEFSEFGFKIIPETTE